MRDRRFALLIAAVSLLRHTPAATPYVVTLASFADIFAARA